MKGFIYILHNPVFNQYGLNTYKIGRTSNLKQRLQSYSTGYVEPSTFLFTSKCFEDSDKVEQLIFYLLRRHRVRQQREFFDVELTTAREVIMKLEKCSSLVISKMYSWLQFKCGKIDTLLNDDSLEDKLSNLHLDLTYTEDSLTAFFEKYRFKPKHPEDYMSHGYKPIEINEVYHLLIESTKTSCKSS
jgi:hypothetical protein